MPIILKNLLTSYLIYVGSLFFLSGAFAQENLWPWVVSDKKKEIQKKVSHAKTIFYINKNINVDLDEFTLAEISSCEGSEVVCAESSAIRISKSPAPGKQNRIYKREIAKRIQDEWPDEKIELSGHNSVLVKASFQEIDEAMIEVFFNEYLKSLNLNQNKLKISAKIITLFRKWRVRPGEFGLDFSDSNINSDRVDMHNSNLLKYFSKPMKFTVKYIPKNIDLESSLAKVQFKFDVQKEVYISKQYLPANTNLRSDMFEKKWVNIRSKVDNYPESTSDFIENSLCRSMLKGRVLEKSFFKKPILIKRGQIIGMEIGSGNLFLTAMVRANEAGQKGDLIDVVYEPTKKRLKAYVVNENKLVEVP